MRKEILVVLMLTSVLLLAGPRVMGTVYVPSAYADCGDIYFKHVATGNTTWACVDDNGNYDITLNEYGNYEVYATAVRKDDTGNWYKSITYYEYYPSDGPYNTPVYAWTLLSIYRHHCDCESD